MALSDIDSDNIIPPTPPEQQSGTYLQKKKLWKKKKRNERNRAKRREAASKKVAVAETGEGTDLSEFETYAEKSQKWKRQKRRKRNRAKRQAAASTTSSPDNDHSENAVPAASNPLSDHEHGETAVPATSKTSPDNEHSETAVPNTQGCFRWPHQKLPQKSVPSSSVSTLEKEQMFNQVLQKKLTTVTSHYTTLQEHHAHCLHTRLSKNVTRRTVQLVEAACVLGAGYSYSQPQLDDVDVFALSKEEYDIMDRVVFRTDGDCIYYVVKNSVPTIYVKEYTGRFNKATLEFKILYKNQNVESVQRPGGIYMKRLHSHYQYLVTISDYKPIAFDCMVTASNSSTSYGELTEWQWFRIFIDVATALHGLHTNKFIHNRVQPSNIMLVLDKKGMVHGELIDFSFACLEEHSRKISQHQVYEMGSMDCIFVDPLVLKGRVEPSKQSDIYAFGQTIKQVEVQNPTGIPKRVSQLADECMGPPKKRPSMYLVCRRLKLIRAEIRAERQKN